MNIIDRLLRRHALIEAAINSERARPAADWSRVATLKKTKLRIKDIMVRLQRRLGQTHADLR